jgi:hypothetical protein
MLRQLFRVVSLIVAGLCIAMAGAAQQVSAPEPQPATLTGTVLGVDGGVVPGAKVVLDGPGADDRQTLVSGDDGSFQFANVRPGVSWRVTISATSFGDWTSNPITLSAGQHFILTGIQLRLATVKVSVNAFTPEQAAAEQVKAEETQRVFGIVPNFYVVYERNHAPLTPKLKFQLAFKALNDPVSLTGFALNAGIYQMVGYPGYRGGMAGYGQRLGATFAGAYTHVLVADAVLASLLHQDPRYFYQGTGTTRSRLLHALSQAVFTTGDDGHREINYSGIGGDLVSGAVANAYYPPGDRGGALVVRSALIGMGGRVSYAVAQEFLLNKHTSRRGGP